MSKCVQPLANEISQGTKRKNEIDNDIEIKGTKKTKQTKLYVDRWLNQYPEEVFYIQVPGDGYCGWSALGLLLNFHLLVCDSLNGKQICDRHNLVCKWGDDEIPTSCATYAAVYSCQEKVRKKFDDESLGRCKRVLTTMKNSRVSLGADAWMTCDILDNVISHFLKSVYVSCPQLHIFCPSMDKRVMTLRCRQYSYDPEGNDVLCDIVGVKHMLEKYTKVPCFSFVHTSNHFDVMYNDILLSTIK